MYIYIYMCMYVRMDWRGVYTMNTFHIVYIYVYINNNNNNNNNNNIYIYIHTHICIYRALVLQSSFLQRVPCSFLQLGFPHIIRT